MNDQDLVDIRQEIYELREKQEQEYKQLLASQTKLSNDLSRFITIIYNISQQVSQLTIAIKKLNKIVRVRLK